MGFCSRIFFNFLWENCAYIELSPYCLAPDTYALMKQISKHYFNFWRQKNCFITKWHTTLVHLAFTPELFEKVRISLVLCRNFNPTLNGIHLYIIKMLLRFSRGRLSEHPHGSGSAARVYFWQQRVIPFWLKRKHTTFSPWNETILTILKYGEFK